MRRSAAISARVLLAVFGGYASCAALSAALAVALPLACRLARAEAVLLAAMLGFLLYLGVLLWSFAEPRLTRVAAVLSTGVVVGYGVVRWLSPVLGLSPVDGA